ncbi:hypothetical protein TgHK011_004007 [Trichoderma gracile]|nr:hypothetical protein TgHK011_004007 [Trichoderma gracile]
MPGFRPFNKRLPRQKGFADVYHYASLIDRDASVASSPIQGNPRQFKACGGYDAAGPQHQGLARAAPGHDTKQQHGSSSGCTRPRLKI